MPGNQLGGESSPYLLQHARNPVQWRPWGEEALDEARRLDRPIFLSIGYATCHWCHVMAHESFEDDDVAELLNRWFIPIKVDREERPDVDSVYMTVCQMMNGHGGWPLTVVLTPDLRPFFSGTYFPRSTRGDRIGMLELLPRLARVWEERRTEVEESAQHVTHVLETSTAIEPGDAPAGNEIEHAVRSLLSRYDPESGGFGSAPKFPSPHNLVFLLRVWEARGDPRHLEVVMHTLAAMAAGGIHDQLAGGFHRYSTDASWKLPHFEKMLYDQALLAMAFVEGFQATGNPRIATVAETTLDYVVRDLVDAGGAFHSAEDADSDGEEGKFYVWTQGDMREALGEEDAATAMLAFGATEEGNFRDEATGERTGANVLLGPDPGPDDGPLDSIRARLLAARERRPRPARDDKILADWNGLAIAALARAGAVLRRPDYVAAAERAAGFVVDHMLDEGGRVFHTWRAGVARIPGLADDYASLALAGVELYGATYDPRWLDLSTLLASKLIEHFEAPGGGFRQVADDSAETLVHVVESADGALPSANSTAIDVLLRLARLTGDSSFEAAAFRALEAVGTRVRSSPSAHTALLTAVLRIEEPTAEAVVVEGADGETARETFLGPLQREYHPRLVALLVPSASSEREEIVRLAPFTADMSDSAGQSTGYLCRDQACGLPMTDPEAFLEAVRDV